MPRHHGLRRLSAFAFATVSTVLAVGLYLASVDPAASMSMAPLPAPEHVAGGPATGVPPAVEPVLEAAATVVVEAPEPEPPAPEPEPEPAPCADALAAVTAAGLPLPAGVDYLCPSTRFAHQGAACWDSWPCPGGAFIAINLDRGAGATAEYLRHVVAHEVCHILDFRDRGWTTESHADACAAAYGF